MPAAHLAIGVPTEHLGRTGRIDRSASFDNSRMDGVRGAHADLAVEGETRLRLVAEQFAGIALDLVLRAGECARITTGAPLPAGADTVVIKENASEHDGQVSVPAGVRAGAHLGRAGEDVRRVRWC